MRNLILSPSSLDAFQSCPRIWQYGKQYLLASNYPDPNADRGTLCYYLLEKYYSNIRDSGSATVEDLIYLASIKRAGLVVEDDTWTLIQKSFREYVEFYTKDWHPVEIEKSFSKVLLEDVELDLRVIIEGKMDLVAKLSDGLQVVVDHKSVTRDDRIFRRLDNQFACYAWATGLSNVVINKFGLQKTKKPIEKFGRKQLSYPPHIIDTWLEQAQRSALELAREISAGGWFSQRFAACQYCRFNSLCEASDAGREFQMRIDFKINKRFDLVGEND